MSSCLRERLDKADVPDEVRKELDRELGRLEKLPTAAPEHSVIRSYIELVLELPWNVYTARTTWTSRTPGQVLDEDHFGLKEVKERILEHLAC